MWTRVVGRLVARTDYRAAESKLDVPSVKAPHILSIWLLPRNLSLFQHSESRTGRSFPSTIPLRGVTLSCLFVFVWYIDSLPRYLLFELKSCTIQRLSRIQQDGEMESRTAGASANVNRFKHLSNDAPMSVSRNQKRQNVASLRGQSN